MKQHGLLLSFGFMFDSKWHIRDSGVDKLPHLPLHGVYPTF